MQERTLHLFQFKGVKMPRFIQENWLQAVVVVLLGLGSGFSGSQLIDPRDDPWRGDDAKKQQAYLEEKIEAQATHLEDVLEAHDAKARLWVLDRLKDSNPEVMIPLSNLEDKVTGIEQQIMNQNDKLDQLESVLSELNYTLKLHVQVTERHPEIKD